MSLFEILVSVQIVVMLLAGVFAYITGRENKARERERLDDQRAYADLRERVDELERRMWESRR